MLRDAALGENYTNWRRSRVWSVGGELAPLHSLHPGTQITGIPPGRIDTVGPTVKLQYISYFLLSDLPLDNWTKMLSMYFWTI